MSILKEIYKYKKDFVKQKKKLFNLNDIIELSEQYVPKGFIDDIKKNIKEKDISIIGELKKASPSAGIIFNNKADYLNIANAYEDNGISCLSILTDEKYFKGSDSDLTEIRKRVSLPIIRKDFIVDSYQLHESKMLGADCILIILSMLEKNNAKDLEEEAISIGLDVLIETHNSNEMDVALEMKSDLIGINNRDLNDFSVDINNSISLTSKPADGKIYVCESGIKTRENIDYIKNNSPIKTFLIGESLMRSDNLKEQIRTLLI
ncbi:indole-3-glycerol phosphate synthase TrpC [Pelagibacteraceae bacterium]|nr:indole-3-glycerol phosphate synthase TrpC [Pelagibacteraceae bacterium]MDC3262732.1 indole-3-glycerol phosphate synthase TrpC [Pelagibacterales bacterium]